MASPEISRRVSQLRHDVDDVFELLDTTNQTVTTIAATQRRHGTRLEEIQQALDLTVGRLDRLEQAQHRIADTQQEQNAKQNAKLDAILAALHGAQTSE